ncbi:XRE family transcriptional regulator [Pseudomonas poae]|nr:XRE family transcriptional regulator [Pseudomonas poae]
MSDQPEHIREEAARLLAIYKNRKRLFPALTQKKLGEKCRWEGQSVVSQYMTGKIPLNMPALLKFAALLEFQPAEVSTRLFPDFPIEGFNIGPLPTNIGASFLRALGETDVSSPPPSGLNNKIPLAPGDIEVDLYHEVNRADGKGSEVKLGGGRTMPCSRRDLYLKKITPESVAGIFVEGTSMEPVLPEGSRVAIDTSAKQIHDGKMYLLDYKGQLRLRLVYKLPENGLRLRSYNNDEYPEENWDGNFVSKNIRILGKVFWYSVLI